MVEAEVCYFALVRMYVEGHYERMYLGLGQRALFLLDFDPPLQARDPRLVRAALPAPTRRLRSQRGPSPDRRRTRTRGSSA